MANITQWLTWSDESLQRLATDGKGGIYGRVNAIIQNESDHEGRAAEEEVIITTPAALNTSRRFAILSHDNQTDPVYNYVNAAGFDVFQWPADMYYSLPSRYSAPEGVDRQKRAAVIESTTAATGSTQTGKETKNNTSGGITYIPEALRVRYPNATVTLRKAVLWNVYDDHGFRRGQTVLFDTRDVTFHPATNTRVSYELVSHE